MAQYYLILVLFLFNCQGKQNEHKRNIGEGDSTERNGYNELANESNREALTTSEYNTDLKSINNIERPDSSRIKNFPFDQSKFFGIWTLDPEGPHADFVIDSSQFYIVDYDGDGSMIYEIDNREITIYYNDFIQTGTIQKVTSDTLMIRWADANKATDYVKWTNLLPSRNSYTAFTLWWFIYFCKADALLAKRCEAHLLDNDRLKKIYKKNKTLLNQCVNA